MISSNEQREMVEACIRAGADSYLVKPLRTNDFGNIWQFVMQPRCHKLQAERREMRLLRAEQIARLKQMQAERLRAIALADVEREKAEREKAETEAARQRAEQQAELDQQKEAMQKEIMRLLHQQVREGSARMCNDVIVHASLGGFFVYLSAGWKAKLGHSPAAVSADASVVHPATARDETALHLVAGADRAAQKGSPRARSRRAARC